MKTEFFLDLGDDINFLKDSFPELEFNLHKAKVNECSFFSVISCCIDNEETIECLWERINNLIGAEYLPTLNDFSSWNIYFILLSPQKISNPLKYTIENDTFFVRKIIFDNQIKCVKKDHVAKLLNDHILGDDIDVSPVSNQVVQSEPNYSPITQSLLNTNLPLGRINNDKKRRNTWLDKVILEVDNHEI
ncbi:hypothetical protein Q4591_12765 [Shewanella sp. 3_MG-2023]|uniref:ABC-three component system middle component 1 n=1 Tax=Shewanella sp. 3_MG-2023 TaxID=3062635 RepID=UPI0026E303EB|nr:ABC-three component system middle component 1 [Shewanella sp. 3_MG-2023]MDO6776230.1 hypothetical protein [Shewanella sp. 3_MG-2023]